MKKFLAIITAVLTLALCACGQEQIPNQTAPATATPDPYELSNSDKFSETSYAGRANVITDTTLSLIVDDKETFDFVLSEKAHKDIVGLEIKMGDRIMVDFETAEDGTKTAISIYKIKDEI